MDTNVAAVRASSGKHDNNRGEKLLNSMFLEVSGHLTVPYVESREKLVEMLGSGKCNLDLSGAELRASDAVKRELFDALRLGDSGSDALTIQILLRAMAWRAPSGPHPLVHQFLRKGSRDVHSAVVRLLAKERRADLERSATPPVPPPLRRRSSELSKKELKRDPARSGGTSPQKNGVLVMEAEEIAPRTTAGQHTDKVSPQPHDELSTFRSATTASELGTSRRADESGGTDEA